MNIGITDFWTSNQKQSYLFQNFTILSDYVEGVNRCYLGKNRCYAYNNELSKYQLYCIVVDDTFFIDFACPDNVKNVVDQQLWIFNHVKRFYKVEYVSIWEKFNLPTVEQLNEFAKQSINGS